MLLNVNRFELKYQINMQEAALVQARLSQVMESDPHNQVSGYFVRSLYFDNVENTSYYEKVDGFEKRKKYRLRIYDFHSKLIKLEIKQKDNETITKDTTAIDSETLNELIHENYDSLLHHRDQVSQKVYFHFKRHHFRPVVIVQYQRTAYKLDFNQIRITVDSDLRKSAEVLHFNRPEITTIPVLEKNHFILEVKYNHFLPKWLSNLFLATRFTRCAASKYCLSRMI